MTIRCWKQRVESKGSYYMCIILKMLKNRAWDGKLKKLNYSRKILRQYSNGMEMHSTVDLSYVYQSEGIIKLVTPMEVAEEIDKNIDSKKAPGMDEIFRHFEKSFQKKQLIC